MTFTRAIQSSIIACLAAACGAGTPGAIESITARQGDNVLHCERTTAEVSVQVTSSSAKQLLQLHLSLAGAAGTGKLVSSWTVQTATGPASASAQVPGTALPDCAGANTYAAKLLDYGQRTAAPVAHKAVVARKGTTPAAARSRAAGVPYDAFGCDIPVIGALTSCSAKGACCDTHDACYAFNGCGASSWEHTLACTAAAVAEGYVADSTTGVVLTALTCYDACDLCNIGAAACFVGPYDPGPSSCCDPLCFTCGVPRNPNNPLGCVADCQCGGGLSCDPFYGACYSSGTGGGGDPGGGGGGGGGGGDCTPGCCDGDLVDEQGCYDCGGEPDEFEGICWVP